MRQALGRNVTLDAQDLFACVIALLSCFVRVLHSLRVHDQACAALQSLAGRAKLIFSKPVLQQAEVLFIDLAPEIWKQVCAVRHLGKSLGKVFHWQPVRSRYSTAQNTSYRSIVRGFVRLRACSRIGRICSKHSRLMSLGQMILNYMTSHHLRGIRASTGKWSRKLVKAIRENPHRKDILFCYSLVDFCFILLGKNIFS